ncbi:hypothetical protein CVT25_011592 [Psilocybe cyanescens]|uniref:Uncharacterized protein n=1 Tax=Psilocybe cyanescens TaxID=93625 RepID=A0A409XCJ3_PSICY|nr:hypothetical protein CVT25_011592 [Psilocybe cyanescens]
MPRNVTNLYESPYSPRGMFSVPRMVIVVHLSSPESQVHQQKVSVELCNAQAKPTFEPSEIEAEPMEELNGRSWVVRSSLGSRLTPAERTLPFA